MPEGEDTALRVVARTASAPEAEKPAPRSWRRLVRCPLALHAALAFAAVPFLQRLGGNALAVAVGGWCVATIGGMSTAWAARVCPRAAVPGRGPAFANCRCLLPTASSASLLACTAYTSHENSPTEHSFHWPRYITRVHTLINEQSLAYAHGRWEVRHV